MMIDKNRRKEDKEEFDEYEDWEKRSIKGEYLSFILLGLCLAGMAAVIACLK